MRHSTHGGDESSGVSPGSWAPPTGPGLLASSLELGAQPWVRNEWRVVEEGRGAEEQDFEGGGLYGYEGEEGEDEEEGERLLIDGQARMSTSWISEIQSDGIEPAGQVRNPRISDPSYVMVGTMKACDEVSLDPSETSKGTTGMFGSLSSKLMERWASLTHSPRELWIIYGLKFLSSYAYFSLMLILTTFLTDEFHFSDPAAGWTYGVYGLMSTLYGLLCGWFIDYVGVRRSLAVGAFLGALARATLALTTSPKSAVLILCTLLPLSECLGIPIMSIGIKRYTNSRNRTYAFSLFYSVMNMAALLSGPAVDFSRMVLSDGLRVDLGSGRNIQISSLRLVILSGSITTALMFFIVLYFVREIDVDAHGNVRGFTPIVRSPYEQMVEVLHNPVFWRLTLFTFLLLGVRLVFRHLDATFPKYLVRVYGPSAPYGVLYSINPLLIIFLVPLVGLMTRHISSFTMIRYGSFIAAASPFLMCIGNSYLFVILFMIVLSVGEAVYSPRVYEYTMEVSDHGAEGMYSSLATAPLFSVQLLVGGMSGWLLKRYMPIHGRQNGRALWAIIGATAMTSPIFISILKEYIHPSRGQEKGLSTRESEDFMSGQKPRLNYNSFRRSKTFPEGISHRRGDELPLKMKGTLVRSASQPKYAGLPPVHPKNKQQEDR